MSGTKESSRLPKRRAIHEARCVGFMRHQGPAGRPTAPCAQRCGWGGGGLGHLRNAFEMSTPRPTGGSLLVALLVV